MKKEAYERLHPWLFHKNARQRVIFYLIADGYTVADLTKMQVDELMQINLPAEIDVDRDNFLEGRTGGNAFVYPSGAAIPHTNYYRLIRATAEKVLGRPMSQEKFREYINT